MRRVSDFIKQLYGGTSYIQVNRQTNVVNIAEMIIARENPSRASLIITNNSVNMIYLHTTNEVAATLGIVLQPGATISFNYLEDDLESTYEWHAAAAANNSNVTIRERILN